MAYVAPSTPDGSRPVAAVTGASSGIGASAARMLAAAGFDVVVGARRFDRIAALAAEIGGRAIALDVTKRESVEAFAGQLPGLNVLVNNAGGALGLEPLAEAVDDHWRAMWESNVFGLMMMTRACLPALERSGMGHIINVGSIAAQESYPGGSGYTSAKHGVTAITETLRLELLGKPIRVTQVDPGMVETEFSIVRFAGDRERAKKVYAGLTPLTPDDVGDIITWVATRPPNVNIDHVRVTPIAQANTTVAHRVTP